VIENNFFLQKIIHLTIVLRIWCTNTLKFLSVPYNLPYFDKIINTFHFKIFKDFSIKNSLSLSHSPNKMCIVVCNMTVTILACCSTVSLTLDYPFIFLYAYINQFIFVKPWEVHFTSRHVHI